MCFHKFHKALKTCSWENKGQQYGEIEVDVHYISMYVLHTYVYIYLYIYILYRVYEYVYVSNYETRMATAKHIARCEGKYTLDNDCLQTGCAGRIRMPSLYFNILQGSPSSRRSYS